MTGKPSRVQANRSFALAWSIPVQGAGTPFIDQSHDQRSPKEQHPQISGQPTWRTLTAQAIKKAAARSKMTNSMATR